jgi:hypothetical protein
MPGPPLPTLRITWGQATAKPGGGLSAWQSEPGFRCARLGPQCEARSRFSHQGGGCRSGPLPRNDGPRQPSAPRRREVRLSRRANAKRPRRTQPVCIVSLSPPARLFPRLPTGYPSSRIPLRGAEFHLVNHYRKRCAMRGLRTFLHASAAKTGSASHSHLERRRQHRRRPARRVMNLLARDQLTVTSGGGLATMEQRPSRRRRRGRTRHALRVSHGPRLRDAGRCSSAMCG